MRRTLGGAVLFMTIVGGATLAFAAPSPPQAPSPPGGPTAKAPVPVLPLRFIGFKRHNPSGRPFGAYTSGPIHYEATVLNPNATAVTIGLTAYHRGPHNGGHFLEGKSDVTIGPNGTYEWIFEDSTGLEDGCHAIIHDLRVTHAPALDAQGITDTNCTFTATTSDPWESLVPDRRYEKEQGHVFYYGAKLGAQLNGLPKCGEGGIAMDATVSNKTNALQQVSLVIKRPDGPTDAHSGEPVYQSATVPQSIGAGQERLIQSHKGNFYGDRGTYRLWLDATPGPAAQRSFNMTVNYTCSPSVHLK